MDILESGPKPDFLAGITDAPVLKECASQTRRILNIQACNIVIDSKFQSCVYIYICIHISESISSISKSSRSEEINYTWPELYENSMLIVMIDVFPLFSVRLC